MTTLPITGLYAGVLALFLIFLSVRVIRNRYRARVGLFDGDDDALGRAIRIHGNFTEYVPLALLLMALAELNGAPGWSIHLMGVLLAAGRVAHAIGISGSKGVSVPRVAGMAVTFFVLAGGAITLIGAYAKG